MAQTNQLINLLINFLVYSDASSTTTPVLRDIDYSRQFTGVPGGNSFSRKFTIPPSDSLTIVDNTRSLTQDATTTYTVELVTGSVFRYRHTAGTAPGFRTDRVTSEDATTELTVTVSGDVVRYDFTGGTAPTFSAAGTVVGDTFVVETDSPFNTLNEGTFTVVTVGSDFVEVLNSNGVAEGAIVLGADIGGTIPPISVFSAAGVQIGDQDRIVDTAFNIENRGIFTVTAVTPLYFEIENANPGIPETSITLGSGTGIVFYPDIFKWLYVEADQKVSVRVNADTSDNFELEPIVAADPLNVGVWITRIGVFSLVIANNGLLSANVKIKMVE